jgi:peptide deformylase
MNYVDASFNGEARNLNITEGIAIAANQVGWDKQVIYVHFDDGKNEHKYLLANPKIKSFSKSFVYLRNGESCLSVKEKIKGIVPRRAKIKVHAYDILNNKNIELTVENFLAVNLQHEIDHLNGILYYDHINKENPFYVHPDWEKI